jgi:histidyl-tRNA synthetase
MSDAPQKSPKKSMETPRTLRGTRDLLPGECKKFRFIEGQAAKISGQYGFEEIETPIIEPAAVFKRSLGDTSDIVSKQMYLFKDLGGDEIVLRPEGTAGVARAFINEGLSQLLPLKLFYRGPMFRYERPQKGRYRQFYQVGTEILGVEKPQADIELILLAQQFLKSLSLEGEIRLHLNTIGDSESRENFREKLVNYLETRKSELSKDSLDRLYRNPLRILDSKEESDRRVVAEAPSLADSLNDTSRVFFEAVQAGLQSQGIEPYIDPLLVRGLDYYCHTVFEFTSNALGSQNAVLAGGRYDNLISDLGGPKTAGVGWGCGVDRLVLMLKELPVGNQSVAIVPLGDDAEREALKLTQELRLAGVTCDLGFSGNMGKRMKRADKMGARCAVILGSDELVKGIVQVKWLASGTQQEVKRGEILEHLLTAFSNNV